MKPNEAIEFAKQWREENACGQGAKVAIALLNALESPVIRSAGLLDKEFLEKLARFLADNVSMGQNSHDEPPDYQSQFDYELAQWADELRNRINSAPTAAEVRREALEGLAARFQSNSLYYGSMVKAVCADTLQSTPATAGQGEA